jgi:hypothetical protein
MPDQVLDRLQGGQLLAAQQHLPPQRGAVERTEGEYRHLGHRDQSSFEDVRTPSRGALDTCTSGTWVGVALFIVSASSPVLRR